MGNQVRKEPGVNDLRKLFNSPGLGIHSQSTIPLNLWNNPPHRSPGTKLTPPRRASAVGALAVGRGTQGRFLIVVPKVVFYSSTERFRRGALHESAELDWKTTWTKNFVLS